ncbi:hypothetical protein [Roseobacter sp. TSBP12]|uniref:hypothetical protein n=1 Tax=Roseobacter sp. TSBP12 TaxID=1236613 RepID=UPI00125F77EB|nr:hypothetical protein [Roseobacter sp. TSBP12]KAB6714306.1 hypothetical protein C8029_21440 [Roseobacter sp. TSBP12]
MTMHDTAPMLRIALAQDLANEILLLATIGAPLSKVETAFTDAGGKVIRDHTSGSCYVDHLGMQEHHTSQPALAIYLWAETALEAARDMQMKDPLTLFTALHRDTKLDALVRVIRQYCDMGMGTFVPPQDHAHAPATHLFEIEFLGIHATGFGEYEAARNWRKAAMATQRSEAA